LCTYCVHISFLGPDCDSVRSVVKTAPQHFTLRPVEGEGWSFEGGRDWSNDEYLEDSEEQYICRCPNCGRILCSHCV
jgi:hypothetical protein